MKVLRGTPKHLSQTGELSSFTYLMLNLLFECNYHCLKCFSKEDVPLMQEYLSLEERLGLIHEAKKLGGKVVVLAGEGEPSLSPETSRIITETCALKMIPIIYTNGSTLTKRRIDFYSEYKVVVMVSFDSLNPTTYDLITGTKNRINKVIERIRSLVDAYRCLAEKRGGLEILNVGINTTVSSLNEAEVAEIKKLWEEEAYFVCNPLARRGAAVINWDILNFGVDIERQSRLIQELSESGGPLTLGKEGICGYSRWGIAVSPSGEYMTCAYTSETNGLLGNIRTRRLKEAFQYKQEMESQHYQRYGKVPCLIRAASFPQYISDLKEINQT